MPIFLLLTSVGKGQNSSLDGRRQLEISRQCSLYYAQGDLHSENWELEEAIRQYEFALVLAKKTHDKVMQAKCLNSIGATHFDNSNLDSALIYANQALLLVEQDTSKAASEEKSASYFLLGLMYQNGFSDYKKSLEYYILSLEWAEKSENTDIIINAYLGLCLTYAEVDYSKCFRFAEKGIEIAQEAQDDFGVAQFQRFIGDATVRNKRVDKLDYARKLLLESIDYYKNHNKRFELADSWGIMGGQFSLQGQLDSAIFYRQLSYDRFRELDSESAIISAAIDLADPLYLKGDYEQVIKILAPYIGSSKEEVNLDQAILLKELLANAHFKLGHYKKAFLLYKSFKMLGDSLLIGKKKEEFTKLQVKFNAEWLEKEQDILQEKNKNLQTRNLLFLWVSILFILLWIGGVISYLKLKKKNNLIELQKFELENLNATKDRLFSIIAHDLRSPLIALGGLTKKINYLLKRNRMEDIQKLGGELDASLDEVRHLTDNLLSWAMIEQGRFPLQPQKVDVAEMVNDCIRLYQMNASAKKITLKAEISQNLSILVDENAIATVIRNLIDNAIKFTHPGGAVMISIEKEVPNVIIKVKDTGIGISEEGLTDLLVLEKAGGKLGTWGEKGSGLGLVLCRELIERNKGTLRVTSKIGVGTTFYISLPLSEN